MIDSLIISCEHGGNHIPGEYEQLFQKEKDILNTHKGLDIGALDLAQKLSEDLVVPFAFSEVSRLLVELNRSEDNEELFSKYTKDLTADEKEKILNEYYFPYREAVENEVKENIEKGMTILHISVHTFTPELEGEIRDGDVGLLFDPSRKAEQDFCVHWKEQINNLNKELIVKYNYPYLGTADGFTTYLRNKYPAENYLGIEIEVNQKFPLNNFDEWEKVKDIISGSLKLTLKRYRKG